MKRLFYLVTCLALSIPLSGQSKPPRPAGASPAAPRPLPKVDFEKYTLPNGLQVILHVDRKLPIVHVNEWFHVGSKNERRGRTGFAHLFEHLMFQGSKNAPGEYFSVAEQAGANIREGGVNGTTSNDRTNYFVTAPSGNLELLLWLESDRVATLADTVTKEKLDNQRDVVKNERRQSLENVPYGRAFSLLFENVFPTAIPYSWPVIGSQEDLHRGVARGRHGFLPAVLHAEQPVAGDRRRLRAGRGEAPGREVLRRHPSRPARSTGRAGRSAPSTRRRSSMRSTACRRSASTSPGRARRSSRRVTPRSTSPAPSSVDGLSSRLQKALVYDKPLASDAGAFQFSLETAGMFVVQATARPGTSPRRDRAHHLARDRAARQGRADRGGAEPRQDQVGIQLRHRPRADRRLRRQGRPAQSVQHLPRRPGEVRVGHRALPRRGRGGREGGRRRGGSTPTNACVRPVPPGDGGGAVRDCCRRPRRGNRSSATDRPFQPPLVQTSKLENGLQLFVVERRDLPKVALTVVTRAGGLADPAGKEGVASLTMRTIDRGTRTRTALQIEDAARRSRYGADRFCQAAKRRRLAWTS